MEVSEADWIIKAIENIEKYLHRGGKCKGDEPQLIGGTDLLNTIGMAMGLPIRDPKDWTKSELEKALKNELVYFVGEARRAIDAIAVQIKNCCGGNSVNYVTVLPIELYHEEKLYELPLFKVKRHKNSRNCYVDNIGRTYSSYDDWYECNKLPPGKMAYPYDLILSLKPGYNYPHVATTDTPCIRPNAMAAKVVDVAAAVAGITSGVGLFFASGGAAVPLAAAGVGSAIWGTGRAGYQLVDKATHNESVNPFTDSESRMLWLGIAANVISFGAMGASMRLTSLAVRGREISNAFRIFVNIANGTNVAVSGIAILDTTIFLANHHEEISSVDILMHVASIAFWTKGLFTYKTAGAIMREAQNYAFIHISNDLNTEQISELRALRSRFGNDAQLLREFHRAAKSNIPFREFSQILFDANRQGQLQFDGLGNILLRGGQRYSVEFLSQLPTKIRAHYFDIVTNLSPEQIRVFEGFRQRVNNDMNLIKGLARVAIYFDLTPREATQTVINFWRTYSSMNLPGGTDIRINEGTLVLGRAPPINIAQLPHLSPQMIRFVSDHLSRLDVSFSQQWSTSVPVLLRLQTWGMFTNCQVTNIIHTGRAVLMLNNQLQVSIFKLNSIPQETCQRIFTLMGNLPSSFNSSSRLPKELAVLITKNRLRLQCHRRESVIWMKDNLLNIVTLRKLVDSQLLNHEQDRLYQFRDTVKNSKAELYMKNMMLFVAERNPNNISDLVAYSEFVVKYVEIVKGEVERKVKDGILKLPPNTNKKEWLRAVASNAVFSNINSMKQKLSELFNIVNNNDMVGAVEVSTGLSDSHLVAAVRQKKIRFASRVSAAYHILKHETNPIEAYVSQANETIRSAGDRYTVNLTQDGDARNIRFESTKGSCIILEKDGRVVLCTFAPL